MSDEVDLGLSSSEAEELVVSLLRQGVAHGYPDGMTQDELSAKFDVVDNQVAKARITLAAVRLMVDGAMDIWVRDDGEVIYFCRELREADADFNHS